MKREVGIETAAGAVCAWRAEPLAPARCAVVVVQEIFGVNAHIRAVAERYAAEGMLTLAPALFDPVERGVELGYDPAGIARGRELAAALGFEPAIGIVLACARHLAQEGHRVAVLGFCWGGTVALLAGLRGALPTVVYYGGRSAPFLQAMTVDQRADAATIPLLLHFGEHDALIPPEHRDLHRSVLPHADIHTYPAGHGFNCEQRQDFDAAAAQAAHVRSVQFFDRHLASASPAPGLDR